VSREDFCSTLIQNNYEVCGPDVSFGMNLKSKGKENYVDWSMKCGHVLRNRIIEPNYNCGTITYLLNPDTENWRRI
jgi:hypothetical protein